MSVYLSISGTATSQLTRVPFAKADYTGVTAPPPPGIGGGRGNTVPSGPNIALVVIPANQTFAEVTITPIDDAIPEKTETAIFTVLNNPAYDLGTPTSTTLFILDNDSASTTLNATADSYVQDGSAAGTNFGSATNLVVKNGPTGFNRYSYLKFDLSNVSTINTVQLQLYGNLSSAERQRRHRRLLGRRHVLDRIRHYLQQCAGGRDQSACHHDDHRHNRSGVHLGRDRVCEGTEGRRAQHRQLCAERPAGQCFGRHLQLADIGMGPALKIS